MDPIPLKDLAQFGLGGVLAGAMFWLYRKDMRELVTRWEQQSTALIGIVKENTAAITALIEVVRMVDSRKERR